MSLANRSITSVTWNAIANFIRLPVGLIQSIVLARLLPVEYFGIFAGMLALVNFSYVFFDFGLGSAFFHRSAETQDEEQAIAVLFSLRLIFTLIWAVILIAVALILLSDQRQLVLIVLTITGFFSKIAGTPMILLMRRVEHRRLAILEITTAIIVAAFSISIAVFTTSIWALLISSVVALVWMIIILYLWKPIWRPHFAWNKSIVNYYLNFGGRSMSANFLGVSIEYADDLWTNIFLGDVALGYYSRAYKFASYPRTIFAVPINKVVVGTYSELKSDHKRLSQAFFRTNAFLIRTGFLFAGWLAVVAPFLIPIILGKQWLPMLDAFRLMLIFALLEPIKVTIAGVLTAVGRPEKVTLVRTIQLLVLVIGLFVLGYRFDIAGVALALDVMVVVGIGLLLHQVKPYVDFSARRLFTAPLIALGIGFGLSWLVTYVWDIYYSDWLSVIVLSLSFGIGYLGWLYMLEGKVLLRHFAGIIDISAWSNRFKSFLDT